MESVDDLLLCIALSYRKVKAKGNCVHTKTLHTSHQFVHTHTHTHTQTHTQREHFKWIRLHDYMNRVINKNSTGKVANSAEQKYRSSANVNCRFKPHCLHSWTSKMQHRAQVPDVTTTLNLHGPPLVWTVRNLVLQKNMEMELKYKRA